MIGMMAIKQASMWAAGIALALAAGACTNQEPRNNPNRGARNAPRPGTTARLDAGARSAAVPVARLDAGTRTAAAQTEPEPAAEPAEAANVGRAAGGAGGGAAESPEVTALRRVLELPEYVQYASRVERESGGRRHLMTNTEGACRPGQADCQYTVTVSEDGPPRRVWRVYRVNAQTGEVTPATPAAQGP